MENLNWDFDNSCFVFWWFFPGGGGGVFFFFFLVVFSGGGGVSVLAIWFYFWRNEKKNALNRQFWTEVGVYFAGKWGHSKGFKSVCTQPQTKVFKVKFDWAQPFSDIESWSWMICIMYKGYILTHNNKTATQILECLIFSFNFLKDLTWKQIFPKKN